DEVRGVADHAERTQEQAAAARLLRLEAVPQRLDPDALDSLEDHLFDKWPFSQRRRCCLGVRGCPAARQDAEEHAEDGWARLELAHAFRSEVPPRAWQKGRQSRPPLAGRSSCR